MSSCNSSDVQINRSGNSQSAISPPTARRTRVTVSKRLLPPHKRALVSKSQRLTSLIDAKDELHRPRPFLLLPPRLLGLLALGFHTLRVRSTSLDDLLIREGDGRIDDDGLESTRSSGAWSTDGRTKPTNSESTP